MANSPDDVVYNIRWYDQLHGWTTTACVNTTLAKTSPEAVVAAYPNALVTNTIFGSIYSVVDALQGIGIVWCPDFYNGTVHVCTAVFAPRSPAPQPEKQTHVESIDLTTAKRKGQLENRALVQVRNQLVLVASGATVTATWTYPDSTSQAVQVETSSSGYVQFLLSGHLDRGPYANMIEMSSRLTTSLIAQAMC